MGQVFKLNNVSIGDILAREQARYARLARTVPKANQVDRRDLQFASIEERAGAYLLRELLLMMDVVHFDDQETIVRMIIPNGFLERLEMWGVDNLDFEENGDVEPTLRIPAA